MFNQTGSELIHQERLRQINVEGWSSAHDDEHEGAELVLAALDYARIASEATHEFPFPSNAPINWPWADEWFKPSKDPIKNLVKAGALLAAEIDRLQRKAQRES